jgi:hypothetical protein
MWKKQQESRDSLKRRLARQRQTIAVRQFEKEREDVAMFEQYRQLKQTKIK